jgi:hypothetical protein
LLREKAGVDVRVAAKNAGADGRWASQRCIQRLRGIGGSMAKVI